MSARIAALEQEATSAGPARQAIPPDVQGQRFLKHAGQLLELQREIKREMGGEAARGADAHRRHRIGAALPADPLGERGQFPTGFELSVETTPVLIELVRRGASTSSSPLPRQCGRRAQQGLPAMEMAFLGNARTHRKRLWARRDLADVELMTSSAARSRTWLADQLKAAGVQPRKVHAISSISAMAAGARRLRHRHAAAGRRQAPAGHLGREDPALRTGAAAFLPIHATTGRSVLGQRRTGAQVSPGLRSGF